jgi:hypothetical protein
MHILSFGTLFGYVSYLYVTNALLIVVSCHVHFLIYIYFHVSSCRGLCECSQHKVQSTSIQSTDQPEEMWTGAAVAYRGTVSIDMTGSKFQFHDLPSTHMTANSVTCHGHSSRY